MKIVHLTLVSPITSDRDDGHGKQTTTWIAVVRPLLNRLKLDPEEAL